MPDLLWLFPLWWLLLGALLRLDFHQCYSLRRRRSLGPAVRVGRRILRAPMKRRLRRIRAAEKLDMR